MSAPRIVLRNYVINRIFFFFLFCFSYIIVSSTHIASSATQIDLVNRGTVFYRVVVIVVVVFTVICVVHDFRPDHQQSTADYRNPFVTKSRRLKGSVLQIDFIYRRRFASLTVFVFDITFLVSDLKAELKKRNLPVSGPKPQLIERLRSFVEHNSDLSNIMLSPGSHSNPNSPPRSTSSPPPPPPPPSPPPLPLPGSQNTPEEDRIIREQQRRIEQLQKQLLNSQLQLQKQQQTRVQTFQVHTDMNVHNWSPKKATSLSTYFIKLCSNALLGNTL